MCQWPTILMVSLYNPEQGREKSPATQSEWAETSLASNSNFGPQKPTAVFRVFDIMLGVMFSHLPTGFITRASGVQSTLWDLRRSTCRRRAALGHNRVSPDALCLILLPMTPDVVMVIYHYVERIGEFSLPPIFLYNMYDHQKLLSR